MATIRSFPVEVLDLIFQYTAEALVPAESDKLERKFPASGRALFPFNVASVCLLWLGILKSHPRYWQRVVIDVADDPTPFLDVFESCVDHWAKDATVDVIVFSSLKDDIHDANDEVAGDVRRSLENGRARTIFAHLNDSGALSCCGTITFDLVYQSSLPSAATIMAKELPFLSELCLSCTIHDYDDDDEMELNDEDLASPPNTTFPSLRKLFLTGYGFMELCQLGRRWLSELTGSKRDILHLSISYFEFRWEHHLDSYQGGRDLKSFLHALEFICNSVSRLSLSHFSLNFRPERVKPPFYMGLQSLSFDSVSRDFLSFFFLGTFLTLHFLSFMRCSLPRLHPDVNKTFMKCRYLCLELVGVQFAQNHHLPVDSGPPPQQLGDDSLCDTLEAFSPPYVRLLRCAGITDAFLAWLCGTATSMKQLQLRSLVIRDCAGFTSGGVRELIKQRKGYPFPILRVEVYGKAPMLSKRDAPWFLRQSESGITYVSWNVDRDESEIDQDLFITDLRPVE